MELNSYADVQQKQTLSASQVQALNILAFTNQELEDFLEHVEGCPGCQEELEIYFTVEVGLKQLEEESGSYNIKGEMEASLEASRQKVRLARLFKIVYYAVDTLTALGIASTILLQLRIWIFP